MTTTTNTLPNSAFRTCCGRRTQLAHARNCSTLAPAPTEPYTISRAGAVLHVVDRVYQVENTVTLDSAARAARVVTLCRKCPDVRGAVAIYARARTPSNAEAVRAAVQRYGAVSR